MSVVIPDSALCLAATDYARRVSPPSLFNHVMRTFAFGAVAGDAGGLVFDRELLYIGSVLHDIGLTDSAPHRARFEIDGADAAREFLSREGMRDADIDLVWEAIALHSTFGLPQRKRPEIALVQVGAAIDIGFAPVALVGGALPAILEAWPRLHLKRELIELVERTYDRNPAVALQSQVVADIMERRRGIRAPNLCDVVASAAFTE